MNKLSSLLLLPLCICIFFVACLDDTKIQNTSTLNIPLNSYSDLLKAKDLLGKSRPYDTLLLDKLLSSTYSNFNYEVIDYNEAFSVLDGVFKEGAYYVWQSLDSTMKTPQYNNLSYWKGLSKMIASRTAEYQKLFGSIESPNPNLQKADSMIGQYYYVLKLSKSTFGLTAKRITPYSVDYKSTEQLIKSGSFWAIYFRHNKEIQDNLNSFPSRAAKARNKYYNDLKDLIIKNANLDHPTSSQLANAVRRFNSITTSENSSARLELSDFLASYAEPENPTPSNNSFWQ